MTHAANFLSRSPSYLGVHLQQPAPALQPTENYVTLSGFDDLKIKTTAEARLAQKAMSALPRPALIADAGLKWDLQDCESEPIRDCFRKAPEHLSRDTEGAITLARSMLEAACKHVLEPALTCPPDHNDSVVVKDGLRLIFKGFRRRFNQREP